MYITFKRYRPKSTQIFASKKFSSFLRLVETMKTSVLLAILEDTISEHLGFFKIQVSFPQEKSLTFPNLLPLKLVIFTMIH